MKHLEIPNVPDELYQQIEVLARQQGRSVQQEAILLLGKALDARPPEEVIVAEGRKNIEELAAKGVFITDDDLEAAIRISSRIASSRDHTGARSRRFARSTTTGSPRP